jgi:hypothetical protein
LGGRRLRAMTITFTADVMCRRGAGRTAVVRCPAAG